MTASAVATPEKQKATGGTPWPSEILKETDPGELRVIKTGELHESPLNPRQHFDAAYLEQLGESLRKGQITPCVVRPRPKGGFELAAGHCRLRAAKAIGKADLLCIVREMNDVTFVEALNIENLQRKNLHALDEARGFRSLMEKAGYKVPQIAERIGLSERYVYDSLKLLTLVPEAQKMFLANLFERSHAIVLSRCTPDQQRQAIELDDMGYGPLDRVGGLFERAHVRHDLDDGEELEFDLKDANTHKLIKPVSVKEFERWVEDTFRFKPADHDLPNLFPETDKQLKAAAAEKIKTVYVTYEYRVNDAARDENERTYGEQSWRRADGQEESKTCDRSALGVVAAGPRRGQAFKVCIDKHHCLVHWPDEARAFAKRDKEKKSDKASGKSGAGKKAAAKAEPAESSWERQERERKERQKIENQWRDRVGIHVVDALAEKVRKMPAGYGSALADLVIEQVAAPDKKAAKLVPLGKTADDLVRHLAFDQIYSRIMDPWSGLAEGKKIAAKFGVNVEAIEKAHPGPADKAAAQTSAKPAAKAKKPASKKPAKKGKKK